MRKKAVILLLFVITAWAFTITSAAGPKAEAGLRSATPTPTPKIAVTPTPAATPGTSQTLEGLQSKIRQRMSAPNAIRGRVGIKIVSLNSGKTIFENDADKYFMPASNMKNFTIATAFERLGPDFKFVTSIDAVSPPDSSGTIKGDLTILGRGDVPLPAA